MVWLVAVAAFYYIHDSIRQHQDAFGHTNNVAYLEWLEKVAWAHSESLGLNIAAYYNLGCGCVVRKHELNYCLPTMSVMS
jgi:acyl-CoA thioester hydrolase